MLFSCVLNLAEWHGKNISSVYDITHNLLEHLQIFLRASEDSREVGVITKFKGRKYSPPIRTRERNAMGSSPIVRSWKYFPGNSHYRLMNLFLNYIDTKSI